MLKSPKLGYLAAGISLLTGLVNLVHPSRTKDAPPGWLVGIPAILTGLLWILITRKRIEKTQ